MPPMTHPDTQNHHTLLLPRVDPQHQINNHIVLHLVHGTSMCILFKIINNFAALSVIEARQCFLCHYVTINGKQQSGTENCKDPFDEGVFHTDPGVTNETCDGECLVSIY